MQLSVQQQCKPILALASILASIAENCQSMNHLKQIHAHSLLTDLHNHSVILGKMLRFAAVSPSGDLPYAQRLFDQMPQPNTFFYNTIIRGYAKSSSPSYCVNLFNQMRQNHVDPDEFTFNFLIKARSRVHKVHNFPSTLECDEIHGAVFKYGFCSHLFVQNALINLYAVKGSPAAAWRVFNETVGVDVVSWSGLVLAHVRGGELELARQVFDDMPEKDVVSWTAMVSGYSKANCSREALELFWEMSDAGIRPDEVTIVSVISACTNLGDVETGMNVHSYINENGFGWMVSLCNALINMYAKCGCVDRAWRVFNNMKRKSLITWNSMISACANHGYAEDAFELFSCMLNSGIAPDGITFLALLIAYTHKGLVDEGYRLFQIMERDYGIEASIEHYGCIVDMLGRAGRLEEAYELIVTMPIPSNDIVWGALLAACRIYGDVNMGERVVKKLLELKPDEGGYYILLRDIYVASGRTAEANHIRQAMQESGAMKNPGYSWVGA
ncbi:pentatricopeptide repeat-containing protein At5g15300 [Ricinus communis]|uniref:Pentatricopeptide repeat-containing protein, putative n=1 Tax=Ricinus communis TaxID=3988 RepID=B9SVI6_RICCO|nr:pentatricopeptide repeat-containing protein At5g15300 [Ricinus communis]EEF32367.1 pentatricopeptide repeat-containing protein, putative [Ricinus communis]|eukprot:XP_002530005.1 pentatricopeptide repeat-containing protein At5g15300 [Ricinus communis]